MKDITEFLEATTHKHFKDIANLASLIWREHYTPIIGEEQVEYMIKNFQSAEAMNQHYQEGYMYFMVKHNSNLAGYIAIEKQEERLFLSKIYISKAFRGQKLGKMAMAFVEKKALEMSCKSITLGVNKRNLNSIAAYEAMGFKKTGAKVTDIGHGFVMDDYSMEKFL